MMVWQRVTKFDPRAARLADRHYSRRKVGSPQFMPPGETVILLTDTEDAVFGWWRPHPRSGIVAMNGLDGWTCTIFRNESMNLSSTLILDAEEFLLGLGVSVDRIQKEQIAFASPKGKKEGNGVQLDIFGDPKEPQEGETNRYKIKPLSSALTSRRELNLGGNGSGPQVQIPFPKTPSEIEQDLRSEIKRLVGLYEWNNRLDPGTVNGEILAHFGKPRAEMTIQELEAVRRHVLATYPQNRIRGTGRPRVPTKAQVWTGPIQEAW